MSKFVFKDDVQLNIAGEEFSLDSTDVELLKRLDEFSKESQTFSNELSKREDYVKAVTEAIEFATNAIDTFLGEGSSKRIFKNTSITLVKALDVINYISEEVGKSRSNSMNKYSLNRAERRKR